MMGKAEKYYQQLMRIRDLTLELQLGEGIISPEEEKEKVMVMVYAYRELGELDKCAELLKKYIRRGTEDQEIVDMYIRIKEIDGRYLSRKQKYQEAMAAFEEALRTAEQYDIDFKKLDMYQSISTIYEKMGDFKMALDYYEKFSDLSNRVYQEKNLAYSKYLIDIYGLENMQQKTKELMERNRDLGRRANMDSLTGIYNRRFLQELITEDVFRSTVTENWGVVMMDIDYFKLFNDSYGHAEGDKVLQTVGGIFREIVDERVFPVRYGGEEFLLLIKEPEPKESVLFGERVMQNLREKKILHKGSPIGEYVTISAGVAEGSCCSIEDRYLLIEEADKRLYESKRLGRNRLTA